MRARPGKPLSAGDGVPERSPGHPAAAEGEEVGHPFTTLRIARRARPYHPQCGADDRSEHHPGRRTEAGPRLGPTELPLHGERVRTQFRVRGPTGGVRRGTLYRPAVGAALRSERAAHRHQQECRKADPDRHTYPVVGAPLRVQTGQRNAYSEVRPNTEAWLPTTTKSVWSTSPVELSNPRARNFPVSGSRIDSPASRTSSRLPQSARSRRRFRRGSARPLGRCRVPAPWRARRAMPRTRGHLAPPAIRQDRQTRAARAFIAQQCA